MFLLLLLFWDNERAARWLGREYAASYRARPAEFPAITVFSREDLYISARV